jgi:deoxyribose-phosphate aldolase
MGCALGTAKVHRRRMYRKMGVRCVEQVVIKAILATGLLLTDEDRDLIACRTDAEAIAWDAATVGKLAHHKGPQED